LTTQFPLVSGFTVQSLIRLRGFFTNNFAVRISLSLDRFMRAFKGNRPYKLAPVLISFTLEIWISFQDIYSKFLSILDIVL